MKEEESVAQSRHAFVGCTESAWMTPLSAHVNDLETRAPEEEVLPKYQQPATCATRNAKTLDLFHSNVPGAYTLPLPSERWVIVTKPRSSRAVTDAFL